MDCLCATRRGFVAVYQIPLNPDWKDVAQMDVSKFYHGDYYLEELKTIEGK